MLIEVVPPVRREAPGAADVPPRKAYVELTTACNLDCAMCLRRALAEPGGEMSLATFRRVVEQCAELPSLTTLNFSGYGEPLVHPLFLEFLALAKGARLEVEVVTNGVLLTTGLMERLVDLRLDKLVVSVDSLGCDGGRDLHSGTFPAVAANLRAFHRLRVLRSAANSTTDDVRDLLAVAAEVPVRTEVTPFALTAANDALQRLKASEINGAAVLVPG